jgi:hypothetical protein
MIAHSPQHEGVTNVENSWQRLWLRPNILRFTVQEALAFQIEVKLLKQMPQIRNLIHPALQDSQGTLKRRSPPPPPHPSLYRQGAGFLGVIGFNRDKTFVPSALAVGTGWWIDLAVFWAEGGRALIDRP